VGEEGGDNYRFHLGEGDRRSAAGGEYM